MKFFRNDLQGVGRSFFIMLTMALSVTFIQCADDVDPNEEANNNLDGTWGVESFRVDGVEQIQYTLNSFEMEYRKETENSGETEWTLVDIFGSTTSVEGDYIIMDDGMRIEIDGDELNLEINGSFLTIDGNVGGEFWEMDAEKE